MANVLGFDIGGVNTKAALVRTQNEKLQQTKLTSEYFPVWKDPKNLANVLLALKQRLSADKLDGVGVTMTAELSDVYDTKREGVHLILACVEKTFSNMPIYILNSDTELVSVSEANQEPLRVAAANWAATGWLVAQLVADCVVVDVGSTSASIIPVLAGKVAANAKTDLDKLMCGELVYTGSLRTNVAATVQSIPLRGGVAGVASELFALSADVHLILGHITEKQYTCETANGKGKTMPQALARLSRVVCADTDMLTNKEIVEMANYIYNSQIVQVAEGLNKVYSYIKKHTRNEVPVVVTGLGKDFIARKSAEKIAAEPILDLATLMPTDVSLATPAFAVALMTAKQIDGDKVSWKQ